MSQYCGCYATSKNRQCKRKVSPKEGVPNSVYCWDHKHCALNISQRVNKLPFTIEKKVVNTAPPVKPRLEETPNTTMFPQDHVLMRQSHIDTANSQSDELIKLKQKFDAITITFGENLEAMRNQNNISAFNLELQVEKISWLMHQTGLMAAQYREQSEIMIAALKNVTLSTASGAEISQLTNQISDLKAKLSSEHQNKSAFDACQESVRQSSQTITELRDAISDLANRIREVDDIGKELQGCQRQTKDQATIIEEKSTQFSTCSAELIAKDTKINMLQEEVTTGIEACKSVTDAWDKELRIKAKAIQEIETKDSQITDINGKISILSESDKKYEKSNSLFKIHVQKLSEQLLEKNKAIINLMKMLKTCKSVKTSCTSELAKQKEQISYLSDRHTEISESNKELLTQIQTKDSEHQELLKSKELEKISSKHKSCSDELLRNELLRKDEELEKLKGAQDQFIEQLSGCQSVQISCTSELKGAQQKNKEDLELLRQMSKQISEDEELLKKKSKQLEEISSKETSCSNELLRKDEELEELKGANEKLLNKIQTTDELSTTLQQELEQLQSLKDKELSDITARYETKLQELNKCNSDKKFYYKIQSESQKKISELNKELSISNEGRIKFESSFVKLQKSCSDELERQNKKLKELKGANVALKIDLSQLKQSKGEQNNELQTKIAQLSSEKKLCLYESYKLNEKLSEHEENITKIRTDMITKQENIVNLTQQLEKCHLSKITDFRNKLRSAMTELTTLQYDKDNWEQSNLNLKQQIQRNTEKLTQCANQDKIFTRIKKFLLSPEHFKEFLEYELAENMLELVDENLKFPESNEDILRTVYEKLNKFTLEDAYNTEKDSKALIVALIVSCELRKRQKQPKEEDPKNEEEQKDGQEDENQRANSKKILYLLLNASLIIDNPKYSFNDAQKDKLYKYINAIVKIHV